MKTVRLYPALSAAILAITCNGALAHGVLQPLRLIGTPATEQAAADHAVVLADATSTVNVTAGSTVRFVVDGRSFAWTFDSATGRVIPFDLARIAPAGWLRHAVTVYVAPNPLYHD